MAPVMLIRSKGAKETTKGVMKDLSKMIKTVEETQFDLKEKFGLLATYMDINECDTAIFFETTKRVERLWLSSLKRSIRFTILSIDSIYDMCTEVNYHKHAGHLLFFTEDFDESPELSMAKEMFEKIFEVDKELPIERVLCFYRAGDSIFIRNYLAEGVREIGPRLQLQLDKVLDGCFSGPVIYTSAKPMEQRPTDSDREHQTIEA